MRFAFVPLVCLAQLMPAQTLAGCHVLPANNVWNTRIPYLPVHVNSANYVSRIGATSPSHADFGSGLWASGPIGIPYATVPGTQLLVSVTFGYADEEVTRDRTLHPWSSSSD